MSRQGAFSWINKQRRADAAKIKRGAAADRFNRRAPAPHPQGWDWRPGEMVIGARKPTKPEQGAK